MRAKLQVNYYAYGLKIVAISSKKLGDVNEGYLKNNNLYNDKELWDDADLNWYDYGFRNYDPQIGRFTQLDPLTGDYPELTPYQYASCEPIANIDIDGLEGGCVTVAVAAETRVTITVAEATADVVSSAASVAGSFLGGILSSAWGTVTGVASAIAHPINTLTNLAQMGANPIQMGQTAKALVNTASNTYSEFKNGNGDVKAGILGHAVGDIAQLFIGTGEAKAATEAIEVANVLEKGAKIVDEVSAAEKIEGGLNLFKAGSEQALKKEGWKAGDRFLNLPNKYNPKLNWKQNSAYLRREMQQGKPIFDSYRESSGNLIKAGKWDVIKQKNIGEFLNAERNLLRTRGWKYSSKTGAWMPPP